MGKVIRPTYSMELSIGLLLLIFTLSFFLSHQIFEVRGRDLDEGMNVYFGAFLVSSAVVIMLLILWEEFLFPIKVKPIPGGELFRNHRTKLKKQMLFYCAIPVIFCFIYLNYEVNQLRFFIWAAICIIAPVSGKLISGINNYNDFLKLTNDEIGYKNNKKEGTFEMKNIQQITLIKDDRNILHKIQLLTASNNQVTIDLDEMELEDFYQAIDHFIKVNYKSLLKSA